MPRCGLQPQRRVNKVNYLTEIRGKNETNTRRRIRMNFFSHIFHLFETEPTKDCAANNIGEMKLKVSRNAKNAEIQKHETLFNAMKSDSD
jgi:hypothetical protein